MDEILGLLEIICNIILAQLVQNMASKNRIATGKTIDSLEVVPVENGFQLIGNATIWALETGRKPTPPGTPASDPTLYEALKDWCIARGIDDKFRYAIAQKIHKEGWDGTPGVILDIINDQNINAIIDQVIDEYLDGVIIALFPKLFYFSIV